MRYAIPSNRQMARNAKRRKSRPGVTLTGPEMEYRLSHERTGEHVFVGEPAEELFDMTALCVWCRCRFEDAEKAPCCRWKVEG